MVLKLSVLVLVKRFNIWYLFRLNFRLWFRILKMFLCSWLLVGWVVLDFGVVSVVFLKCLEMIFKIGFCVGVVCYLGYCVYFVCFGLFGFFGFCF